MALGVALAALIGLAAPTQARSPFDGHWLVTIRSVSGPCQSVGRYRLRIHNGRVPYRGLVIRVRGRVDRRGRVNLRLDGGEQWAREAGRLSKHAGAGIWRRRLHHRACAGRWWARRR